METEDLYAHFLAASFTAHRILAGNQSVDPNVIIGVADQEAKALLQRWITFEKHERAKYEKLRIGN